MPIWTSQAGNQLGTDGNLYCCGWLWSNATGMFCEDYGSPNNDNNDSDDERMAPFKDESEKDWKDLLLMLWTHR